MFKYKTDRGIVSVAVGKQNFEEETVEVLEPDQKLLTCSMFQDEDGDIGFYYHGEPIYFYQNIKHN